MAGGHYLNRDILECKWITRKNIINPDLPNLNRDILECKCWCIITTRQNHINLNRDILECKCRCDYSGSRLEGI